MAVGVVIAGLVGHVGGGAGCLYVFGMFWHDAVNIRRLASPLVLLML